MKLFSILFAVGCALAFHSTTPQGFVLNFLTAAGCTILAVDILAATFRYHADKSYRRILDDYSRRIVLDDSVLASEHFQYAKFLFIFRNKGQS